MSKESKTRPYYSRLPIKQMLTIDGQRIKKLLTSNNIYNTAKNTNCPNKPIKNLIKSNLYKTITYAKNNKIISPRLTRSNSRYK